MTLPEITAHYGKYGSSTSATLYVAQATAEISVRTLISAVTAEMPAAGAAARTPQMIWLLFVLMIAFSLFAGAVGARERETEGQSALAAGRTSVQVFDLRTAGILLR